MNERFLTGCERTCFPDRFAPRQCLWSIISRLRRRGVKCVRVFICNLQPTLLAVPPGLARATATTRGWNGHRIRVSTERKLWRWKFSRRSGRESNLRPLHHECVALLTELSRLTGFVLEEERHHQGEQVDRWRREQESS